jgi:signal transduction histidine kinase
MGKRPERVRWRVPHKSGKHDVWLESNPSLLRDPATEAPTGFLDVIRDVTAQVGQEEALAAARAEAEAAAAVKGEFMANMSHEIRTPLTAVIGFSGLLAQRPELDEISQRYVQRVSSAGQALLAIVNDVLDFSKLEAGQVEIAPRPVSPLAVAQDALALFAPQADSQGAVAGMPGRRRPARAGHDRSGPCPAGAAQPGGQRDQVHRAGRGAAVRRL